jgi:hypothetical protein
MWMEASSRNQVLVACPTSELGSNIQHERWQQVQETTRKRVLQTKSAACGFVQLYQHNYNTGSHQQSHQHHWN